MDPIDGKESSNPQASEPQTDDARGQAAPGSTGDQATVAFCQQCGRGLTMGTQRRVDSGIFCEPCAAVRQTAAPVGGYSPVPGPTSGFGSLPPAVGEPNPVLAGFLGLIPGVGAMYNGQYPKGVIHLVIFVVLTSLADNLNWVLWWFVWGWIFYQAFEAYHTALARRDGLPLPDPFGWNDLGDRLGFARTNSPASVSSAQARQRAAATATTAAVAGTGVDTQAPYRAPVSPSASSSGSTGEANAYSAVPYPASAVPDWTATVPPAAAASHPVPPWTENPPQPTYGQTFTGVPYAATASSPAVAAAGLSRFPGGAAWLIGLGILFLVGNIAPGWRLQARWLVPGLLALLAIWTGGRRLQAAGAVRKSFAPGSAALPASALLSEALLGPVLLLTLAVLLALQTAQLVLLRHSWPAMLIVWGALLLIGRAQVATIPIAPGNSTSTNPAPGSVQDSVSR